MRRTTLSYRGSTSHWWLPAREEMQVILSLHDGVTQRSGLSETQKVLGHMGRHFQCDPLISAPTFIFHSFSIWDYGLRNKDTPDPIRAAVMTECPHNRLRLSNISL